MYSLKSFIFFELIIFNFIVLISFSGLEENKSSPKTAPEKGTALQLVGS